MASNGEKVMASLDDLVSNIKNGVIAIGNLTTAIKAVFPQLTTTATSATAGAQTLPSNPAGFLNVTLPNGTPCKIPYYNQ